MYVICKATAYMEIYCPLPLAVSLLSLVHSSTVIALGSDITLISQATNCKSLNTGWPHQEPQKLSKRLIKVCASTSIFIHRELSRRQEGLSRVVSQIKMGSFLIHKGKREYYKLNWKALPYIILIKYSQRILKEHKNGDKDPPLKKITKQGLSSGFQCP